MFLKSYFTLQHSWRVMSCLIIMFLCDFYGYITLQNSFIVILWKSKLEYAYVAFWHTSCLAYVKLVRSSILCHSDIHKGLCYIATYLNTYVGLWHSSMSMWHCNLHLAWIMLNFYIPEWFWCTTMSIDGYVIVWCSQRVILDCDVH